MCIKYQQTTLDISIILIYNSQTYFMASEDCYSCAKLSILLCLTLFHYVLLRKGYQNINGEVIMYDTCTHTECIYIYTYTYMYYICTLHMHFIQIYHIHIHKYTHCTLHVCICICFPNKRWYNINLSRLSKLSSQKINDMYYTLPISW